MNFRQTFLTFVSCEYRIADVSLEDAASHFVYTEKKMMKVHSEYILYVFDLRMTLIIMITEEPIARTNERALHAALSICKENGIPLIIDFSP